MGLVRAGIGVFLTALALAPAAQAAQRYAAPAGSGAECTQAKPCSLSEALTKAKANDEVIVTSGSYTAPSTLALSPEATGAYVHGDFGGPRPTITGSFAGPVLGMNVTKSRVSHLDLANNSNFGTGLICGTEGTAERVKATAKGMNAIGVQVIDSCLLRDSVIRSEGESSAAVMGFGNIGAGSGAARNLTAIATGPNSDGLRSSGSIGPVGPYTMVVRNSIVSGDGYDLQSSYNGFTAGNIDVAYSNFDLVKQDSSTTITQGPGNQTAAPLFVDRGAGDYREAAGSPTIDGGTTEGIPATDFDGNSRSLGAAPDLGAYEFVPPPVPVAAPGEIQSLTVAPKAFKPVNAGGAILSAKKRKKAPVSTTVTYSLSAAGTVAFSVERKLVGRKVGKRCVKKTKANKAKKKCPLFKLVKGGFSHAGAAGQNRFKFSGRVGGKALKPGTYRLTGKTGTASRRAGFRIVK
jgi:hypothetical protein